MTSILFFSLLSLLLTLFLALIMILISYKNFLYFDSLSPFECGFSPKNFYRTSFSLHFFLVAILFLIFDIELILLFPLVLVEFAWVNVLGALLSFFFLLILLVGVTYEWNMKSLEWTTY